MSGEIVREGIDETLLRFRIGAVKRLADIKFVRPALRVEPDPIARAARAQSIQPLLGFGDLRRAYRELIAHGGCGERKTEREREEETEELTHKKTSCVFLD